MGIYDDDNRVGKYRSPLDHMQNNCERDISQRLVNHLKGFNSFELCWLHIVFSTNRIFCVKFFFLTYRIQRVILVYYINRKTFYVIKAVRFTYSVLLAIKIQKNKKTIEIENLLLSIINKFVRLTDQDAIVCPFELMGQCEDKHCTYKHLTS